MLNFNFKLNVSACVRASKPEDNPLRLRLFRGAKMIALAMALAASTASLPTGREMYVGCYLLVQGKDVPEATGPMPDPYSAASCVLTMAIGAKNEAAKEPGKRRFCIPSTIATNPYRDMALAYLDFYESAGGKLAELNGVGVAAAAMAAKWPCE